MTPEPAPAKINLALHVRRRRPDGYHDLETLFAFAQDGDLVQLEQAEEDSFAIDGPFASALHSSPGRSSGSTMPRMVEVRPGDDPTPCWGPSAQPMVEGVSPRATPSDNLVTRARDAFRATFPTPHVAITLTKNLPVASGIGGGSADAAAALRALARLTGIAPDHPRLAEIAATLGADVPVCLAGRTALGTGRGDTLADLDGLAGTPLLLVNPGIAVPTAAVFAAWDGIDRGPLPEGGLLARARAGRNDLEPAATALVPAIADVRALLDAAPGVLLSRMSGSGATCFALFASLDARDLAADRAGQCGWWTLPTTLA